MPDQLLLDNRRNARFVEPRIYIVVQEIDYISDRRVPQLLADGLPGRLR